MERELIQHMDRCTFHLTSVKTKVRKILIEDLPNLLDLRLELVLEHGHGGGGEDGEDECGEVGVGRVFSALLLFKLLWSIRAGFPDFKLQFDLPHTCCGFDLLDCI